MTVLDPWFAYDEVLNSLDYPPGPHPEETSFYGWHPLPLHEWLPAMVAARDHLVEERRCWTGDEAFLDVGSGTGTKLALASALGWGRVEGVEHHASYAELSRHRWPDHPVTVAAAVDFDRYDEFDLVYSYRLCVDLGDQRELTALIAERMRVGALLFAAGGPDPDYLVEVAPGVWQV